MAWLAGLVGQAGDTGHEADPERDQPATHEEMEGMFRQLAETLDAIDFHKGRAPDSAMRTLRRLFLRSRLDPRAVRLLRGIPPDAPSLEAPAVLPFAPPEGPGGTRG